MKRTTWKSLLCLACLVFFSMNCGLENPAPDGEPGKSGTLSAGPTTQSTSSNQKPRVATLKQALTEMCGNTLKVGETVRRSISITLPSVPPKADVMFSSDLTSSMVEEVAKAKTNSTNIMNQITNLIPDTWFGAMSFKDYAASYNHCGYGGGTAVLYGSGNDFPYKLDQAITSNKTSVSSAINTWNVSTDPNTDYPASYTRALWEMYNDSNVGWRSGSKRFIILFADALPHDCSYTVSPYTVNTGVDPGRDAIAGTSDDLGWSTTITGLANNNISLITMYSGDKQLSLGGGPPLRIFDFWETNSQATDGDAFQLDKQGNLPNNTDIAQFIQQKVQALSANISNLTIGLCTDQNAQYQNWLSNPSSQTNVTSGTGPHNLGIDVTPPNGTSPGTYVFEVCIYGDGVEYARQSCSITVTNCTLPGFGDPCTVGTGACERTGTRVCNASQTALVCSVSAGTPGTETCNEVDDDCDGSTDENFTNKGTSCTVGQGQCQRNGTYVCKSDGTGTECSVSPGTAVAELCNGLDDDCDGSTDEDFTNKGNACTVGLGECQSTGTYVCNASGSNTECSATPGSSTSERCNGLDDDCDGSVDENWPSKGNSCTNGVGECQRSGTYVCNASGSNITCNATAGSPTTEICDAKDNDCDGSVDEGFSNKGSACTVGIGECQRSGTFVCNASGSATVCSATPGSATSEICDGKDNDCDGQTDENWSNKGQSCTVGLGVCERTGTYVCNAAMTNTTCSVSPGSSSAEICDGLDNDCDGSTDENWPNKGTACTVGLGECQRNGTYVCNAARTNTTCSATAGSPIAELCNGKDDDCDGSIDENFTTLGDPCTAGTGVCQRSGNTICRSNGTGTTCSATPGSPSSELCNGLDDDCDGSVDENFSNKGSTCTVGQGECQRSGIYQCNASGSNTVCSATAGNPTAERCDGLDNDCDGSVDENFSNKGNSCTNGTGACERTGTYVCNASGSNTTCNATPGSPTSERCNGIDDDCDGSTDEDFTNKGNSCTVGQGECQRSGNYVCNASGSNTTCSATAGSPIAELCNGKDDDCDGSIDENFPDKNGSCTNGLGECQRSGTYVCNASGSSLTCNATPGSPATETCDTKDNDCDGQIDEGCNCVNNTSRSCYSGTNGTAGVGPCKAGTQTCTNGNWGSCVGQVTPISELCDGIDNDCDGSVDENFPEKNTTCNVGTGACRRTGTFICNAAKTNTTCNVTAGSPTAELCDNIDNDCDGQTDEDFTNLGSACSAGTGPCQRNGTYVCNSAKTNTTCSAQAGNATAEVCDGIDNDCDGQTDEDFTNLGQSCTAGTGPCQRTGTYVCNAAKTNTTCSATAGTPSAEKCDGIDNDCDGQTDEDFNTLGNACTVGEGECKQTGKVVCRSNGSGTTCSAQAGQGTAEKCDGADNDCDGRTDEDFANLGAACTVGKGECVKTGKYVCKPDGSGLDCDAKAGAPATEVCDGKDNDCDGSVDEDFNTLGNACTVGKGECEQTGKLVCKTDGSGTNCDATAGTASAEKCDGKDNDCDGQTDEDFTTLGQACTIGQGECVSSGKNVCHPSGNAVRCDAPVKQGTAEKCDGKDNDCDGQTDEDFTNLGDACSAGKGECKQTGKVVCKADGSQTECDAKAKQPSPEICDGLDNNCDDKIDENVTKECSSACGKGTQICTNGKWGACDAPKPVAETCDNKDNDCDGAIDNGLVRPCETDCGKGTETCTAGQWIACTAPAPTTEVCDGKDNDCDGKVDEDIASKPCQGACGTGTANCESGVFVGCSDLQPKPETCDGVDNDCDGKIDNLDPRACRSECGEGKETCVEGFWKNCDAPKPSEETCDGKDNNCDGFVDNKAPCPDGKGCNKGQCSATCKEDSDCGEKEECSDGFCIGDPCVGVNCDKGKTCISGHCVDACALVTCPDGKVCREGQCVEDSCYALGCPGGQICRDGKCQPDLCIAVKCKDNEACREGQCVPSCAWVQCKEGETCNDGKCIPAPCDGKCPNDRVCVDGNCVADPCAAVECTQGRVCDPKTQTCVDDPCLVLRCPDGQSCKDGQCSASSGQEPPPAETTSDSDEQNGENGNINKNTGDAGPNADSDIPPPPGGCACGCSTTPTQGPVPASAILFLLAFLLLTRRKHS